MVLKGITFPEGVNNRVLLLILIILAYCCFFREKAAASLLSLPENRHWKLFLWIPDQVRNDKPEKTASSKA
jgi:hypothetical protein